MPHSTKDRGLSWAQLQMLILAGIAAVLTVASLTYILLVRPPYLRATRYGAPYSSSQVINPVTQQPMALNTLAYHYTTGKQTEQTAKQPGKQEKITLPTMVQIGMFFVAFYIMYLAFIKDPFGK
jgi:hypothetical protein